MTEPNNKEILNPKKEARNLKEYNNKQKIKNHKFQKSAMLPAPDSGGSAPHPSAKHHLKTV